MKLKHWLMIPLSLIGILMLLVIRDHVDLFFPVAFFPNDALDMEIKYQILAALWATLFVALTYFLYRGNFKTFFRLGELDAPAEPVRWLISEGQHWRTVGRTWAIILTFGTSLFLLVGVLLQGEIHLENLRYLLLALPIAASNAYVEEMVSRYAVVAALWSRMPNKSIYLISALVFGIPHYFGIPGGIIGSLMAGFLGWLLARSIVDTKGVFWAWFLHFLQDVVIFIVLILTLPT